MATTTFSGPIKAGTIKNTTGTVLGSSVANVGQVVMAQTFSLDLSGGAVAAQVTAPSGATNLSIGDTVGGAATILNTFGSGTAAGRVYPTTQAGGALVWQDTGVADIRLTATASAATNAGLVRFTILYQQNNNLA